MNASSRRITQFLSNVDFQFVVPVYQRNYDWSIENCEQLWDDLVNMVKINKPTHFMGALVTIYNSESGDKEYIIIDGQQRLTTLSLLLLALHDSVKAKDNGGNLPEKIMNQYLMNPYSKRRRIKLKPINKDNEAFIALFENKRAHTDSNIYRNYDFFKRRIDSMKITPDELLDSMTKLEVVEIELKSSDDNPQLIFESINSTGLGLSEADLVRNYVLMNLTSKTQEEYYQKYWNPIELNTEFKVDSFLRDYLTLKERITPTLGKVYRGFKRYTQAFGELNIKKLLSDILTFSEYYNKIVNSESDNLQVKKQLSSINELEMTVVYPFLLEVWDDWKKELIDSTQVVDILKIIESFLFRRAMCDVPTNALNKLFMVLGKDLKKLLDNNYKEYVTILKYLLTDKKSSQRYPNNEEFFERLKYRDVYHLRSKTKLYLLQNLENYQNKEKVHLSKLLADGTVNVEHVMPQTLTPKWQKILGSKSLQIHDKYLHTIGNLTLTGYNSKLSNKPFLEKRDMEDGFKDSRFLMNKYLSEQDTWNETKIEERADVLLERALKIWPYYNSKFKPKKDASRLVGISEDHDYTGERPESLIIEDKEFKVTSWRDVVLKVMDYLYNIDSDILYYFADSKEWGVDRNKEKVVTAGKVAEDLYIELHMNSNSFIGLIRKVLAKYNIDEENISIYLKENGSKE